MELIYAYTRADALRDGVLVDVSHLAREFGFKWPVAVTQQVWEAYIVVPDAVPWQDETGRLADIITMLRHAINRDNTADESDIRFVVCVQNQPGPARDVALKATCGPGDGGEPVITIMLPTED